MWTADVECSSKGVLIAFHCEKQGPVAASLALTAKVALRDG